MGPLIDKVAEIAGTVPGVAAVHQNSRAALGDTPAAIVEAVCEGEHWERELGGGVLRLESRVSLSLVVALPGDEAGVGAARDQALDLARACRVALDADPTLAGLCAGGKVGRADFSYITRAGADYAQAQLLLDAWREVEI